MDIGQRLTDARRGRLGYGCPAANAFALTLDSLQGRFNSAQISVWIVRPGGARRGAGVGTH
jgi:hypothetical protein